MILLLIVPGTTIAICYLLDLDLMPGLVIVVLLACWLIQLSSAMFGISGFRWCHQYGTLSKAGMIASSVVQLIPCVDGQRALYGQVCQIPLGQMGQLRQVGQGRSPLAFGIRQVGQAALDPVGGNAGGRKQRRRLPQRGRD